MADFQTKQDDPVPLSDAYRRSKRNVLFWAVVTFLLPLGVPTEETTDRNAEISPFLRNIEFDQGLLVAVSFVIMWFMAIGFIRADRRLSMFSSPMAIAVRLGNAADLAEETTERLHELGKEAIRLERVVTNQLDDARSFLSRARDCLPNDSTLRSDDLRLRDSAEWHRLNDSHDLGIGEIMQLANRAMEHAVDEASRSFDKKMQVVREGIASYEQTVDIEADAVDRTFKETSNLASSADALSSRIAALRSFSKSIGREEHAWLWLEDRAVVVGAVTVASLVALNFGNVREWLMGLI